MVLNTIQKVWKSGGTLCVAVPKEVATILGLEQGDYLQVNWAEIIKIKDLKGNERIARSGKNKGKIIKAGKVIGNIKDLKIETDKEIEEKELPEI